MAVRVSALLLGIRSRLGDTDPAQYRYSDPEIIDAVNDALAHLSEELLCFSKTWILPTREGVGVYPLPEDHLETVSVRYNGEVIHKRDMLSMAYRETKGIDTGVSVDLQTVRLYPESQVKDGQRISMYYHYTETINDKSDTIALPGTAKLPIIYFALGILYENPIKKDGASHSNRAQTLFEKYLIPLRSRLRKNAQSGQIRSRHTKV